MDVCQSEKRKVDSSILSLTTHSHQRIMPMNCESADVRVVLPLPVRARSRLRAPAAGQCLVHVGCTDGQHAARARGHHVIVRSVLRVQHNVL